TVMLRVWARPGFRLGFMALLGEALHVLADHIRAALGDHQGGRVGVARGDRRHDRGVDYAQALDPAHAQARVDDRPAVGVRAHPAGPDRVEDRGADVAGSADELLVALEFLPGEELLGPVPRESRATRDAAREPEGRGSDAPVDFGREVVRADRRRSLRV